MAYYAGLDLHKSTSVIVVKDQEGNRLREGNVPNDPQALHEFFTDCQDQPLTVALEATTTYAWMYDTLESLGYTVQLAHPLKVRAIASARIKTDRIDAGVLCDLLRANLLPTSYVPTPEIRAMRELLRHRIRLVQDRTHVKHRLTTLLAKTNQTVPGTDPFGVKGRALLATLPLPPMLAWQREDGLSQLALLNEQITRIDRQLRILAREYPDVPRLSAIPGIGIFSALLILSEIGEIQRFPSAKQLVGYAGLAPGLYQSGNTRHGRGITRQGSRYLRWILVEASYHVIRHPGPLRQTYLRLTKGKGHGKALVAVARKLLVGIYAVLHDGQTFCPTISKIPSSGARCGD
jgi:transposase